MIYRYILLLLELLVFVIAPFIPSSQEVSAVINDNTSNHLIENSSMEIVEPINWSNNSWGDNDARFTFLKGGYSSDFCVQTEITEYENGDAKWFFNPIELSPRDYVFRDYYKSDVDTKLILAITTYKDGIEYVDLPIAYPSQEWEKYEAVFAMPKYAKSATIYHLLSQKGYLITDAYEIEPYDYMGFDQGYVTITFDDGWEENTETALTILEKFDYKTNQFYATAYIENSRVGNAKEKIQLFIDAGHEIGSHSVTHPYLTKLTGEDVVYELEESKSFLENYLDIEINYFATPYGAYNADVNRKIMDSYSVHRTAIDFGYNSKDNLDLSRLKCMSVLSTTTSKEIKEWVAKAKEEKLWLVLLYHKITDTPNEYDTTPDKFLEHLQIISDADVSVVTISEAIEEISKR